MRASPSLEFLALRTRLSGGEHVEADDVVCCRARDVTLTFERRIKVNTDGEVMELAYCHHVVGPVALRLVAPGPAGGASA